MANTNRELILPEGNGTNTKGFTKPALAGLLLAVALFVAARLWHLTTACLWFDELFSVHAARHDWNGLISFVAADIVHPPLFYLLLKVWITIGGDSLLWLRLFPALTAIATLIPFFFLCRELNLRAAEINLAVVLMAVSGHLIKYAQELRMYSLLLLLTLCSLVLFVRFFYSALDSKRCVAAALFAVNLLLVYTHYYGWMVIGVEWFFLLLARCRELRSFSIAVAILALCFAPWVYTVAQAGAKAERLGQNIGWAVRPGFYDLAEYYASLNSPFGTHQTGLLFTVIGAMLFGCPVLLWVWRFFREGEPEDQRRIAALRWLVLFSFLPVALTFFLSRLLPQSIWGVRHLIIVAVPYLMLVSIAIHRARPYWIKITGLLLVGCWCLLAGFLLVTNNEKYIWCAWDGMTRQMIKTESQETNNINVYAFEDLVAYHVWFALDSVNEKRFRVVLIKGIPGQVDDPAYFLPRGFHDVALKDATALDEDNYWVAFRDASANQNSEFLKNLSSKGYQIGECFSMSAQGNTAFLVPVRRR